VAQRPRLTLTAAVLDAPDARELADFYRRLLGWTVVREEPDWVKLAAPEGGAGLSFQTEANYVRPTWPAGPGDQQMMVHLDIEVDDLDAAGAMPSPRARPSRSISPKTTFESTSTPQVIRSVCGYRPKSEALAAGSIPRSLLLAGLDRRVAVT
jgi:hypothetical protein